MNLIAKAIVLVAPAFVAAMAVVPPGIATAAEAGGLQNAGEIIVAGVGTATNVARNNFAARNRALSAAYNQAKAKADRRCGCPATFLRNTNFDCRYKRTSVRSGTWTCHVIAAYSCDGSRNQ